MDDVLHLQDLCMVKPCLKHSVTRSLRHYYLLFCVYPYDVPASPQSSDMPSMQERCRSVRSPIAFDVHLALLEAAKVFAYVYTICTRQKCPLEQLTSSIQHTCVAVRRLSHILKCDALTASMSCRIDSVTFCPLFWKDRGAFKGDGATRAILRS